MELLTIIAGKPVTKDGYVGVVMLRSSGQGADSQWFDWRPSFYATILRVEWDPDTMLAVIPAEAADALVSKGYARLMTSSEVDQYNGDLEEVLTAPAKVPPGATETRPEPPRIKRSSP